MRDRTSYGPRRVPGCNGMSVDDAHYALMAAAVSGHTDSPRDARQVRQVRDTDHSCGALTRHYYSVVKDPLADQRVQSAASA